MGECPKVKHRKIFRLQKRAARIVLNVPKDSPSAYVFNQLKWMSLYQRIFYQKCLLMYFIINNVYPSYLHTYVKAHLVNHYNLRSKNQNLSVPFPHKEIYKKSFQYAGAKIWNNLPKTLKIPLIFKVLSMHVKNMLYAIVLFIISCAILSYEFKSCCDNSFYFILFIQSRCILMGPLEDWYYVLKGLPILLYILPDILIFFIVMYIYSNECYLILSYLILFLGYIKMNFYKKCHQCSYWNVRYLH